LNTSRSRSAVSFEIFTRCESLAVNTSHVKAGHSRWIYGSWDSSACLMQLFPEVPT
jgi:hypothetical protein